MNTLQQLPLSSPFDAIRRTRPDGSEYWGARDMQPLMGYSRWDKLKTPLARAIATAKNQGLDVAAHFPRSGEVSPRRGPAQEDYELSRMAAYLVAMNGDPNKAEVAAAQMYFAGKTREAELAQGAHQTPASGAQVVLAMAHQLVEQEQRLVAVEATAAATAAKVAAIEGNHDWLTALGYAKLHDHGTERSYLSRVGTRATAIMKADGQKPHKRQDATFGLINVYPIPVLEQAFAEVAAS